MLRAFSIFTSMSTAPATAFDPSARKHKLIVVFSIFAICFVVYGNSLKNEYALDDELVILNNDRVQRDLSWNSLGQLFKEHYATVGKSSYSYRPVTMVTFALEYHFFGENPTASHLISIMLYALTCVLLYFLLLRIFREHHWTLSALVVLLFLVHPIHTEVVDNIKCRDELLAFLFALISLRSFIYMVDTELKIMKGVAAIFATLLFIMAAMSKPSCMPFLAIIPLTLWYYTKAKLWQGFAVVLICLLGGYALVRMGVSSNLAADKAREVLFHENPLFAEDMRLLNGFSRKLPMAFYSIGYYFKLLVVPHPLVFYYGYNQVPIAGWSNIWAIISMLIFTPAIAYTLWKVRTKQVWVYGSLLFFLSISMFSNFVAPAVGIIAERFAYEASFGFCIVLAWAIFKICKIETKLEAEGGNEVDVKNGLRIQSLMIAIAGLLGVFLVWKASGGMKLFGLVLGALSIGFLFWTLNVNGTGKRAMNGSAKKVKLNTAFVFIVGILVVLGAMRTVVRNGDWKDKDTLYNHDIAYIPNSAKAHALIAGTLAPILAKDPNPQARGDLIQKIIKHYNEALRIYPDYHSSANNLGTIYFSYLGQYEQAMPYFQQAINANPEYVEAHHNLGYSYEKLNQNDAAIKEYYQSLGYGEQYHKSYQYLYKYLAKSDESKIEPVPEFGLNKKNPLYVFSQVYDQLGYDVVARRYYSRYKSKTVVGRGAIKAHQTFAKIYEQLGMPNRAAAHHAKLLVVSRDYYLGWDKLSKVLLRTERLEEAKLHNKVGILAYPQASAFLLNLGNVYATDNQLETGLIYFERGYELEPTYSLADHLYQHYRNEGDTAKAQKYYQEAARLNPNR